MSDGCTCEATVVSSINNIVAARLGDGQVIRSRIKGKVLDLNATEYNPLAPGDRVCLDEDGHSFLVAARLPRRNAFRRWNSKRMALQTLAANLDVVYVCLSVQKPPFRPRFADRALALAELEGLSAEVIVNKADLGVDAEAHERLQYFRTMGYRVHIVSARTCVGVEALKRELPGRAAFSGHSGVGKSSILNVLYPHLDRTVRELSRKYDRGAHTTRFGELLSCGDHELVDTPGVRELSLYPRRGDEIAWAYRDIRVFGEDCRLQNCTHVHEPGCAVIDAFERGDLHEDRYESYLRVLEQLHSEAEQDTDYSRRASRGGTEYKRG